MSVEYALMLVVITGAVVGVLGLGVTDWFKQAECAIQSAMTGACGTLPAPGPAGSPAEPQGDQAGNPGPTGGPGTQPPSGVPARPCDSTSSTSATSSTSGTDPSTSDCPTPSTD